MTARMHDEVSVVTGAEGGQASAATERLLGEGGRAVIADLGQAAGIARAALFLALDEPSCATGADLVVDAGWRA